MAICANDECAQEVEGAPEDDTVRRL